MFVWEEKMVKMGSDYEKFVQNLQQALLDSEFFYSKLFKT
jgi:hypothetical protein